MRRITSLSISTPKANAICWAMRGQPQLGLRRFMATTASMSSCFGPCRARPTPALWRKQQAVLSFFQRVVEIEQSRSLQNNGGTEDACWAHEKSAQTDEHTIRGAIEDPQLMFDEHRLGHHGPEASWPC